MSIAVIKMSVKVCLSAELQTDMYAFDRGSERNFVVSDIVEK